MRLQSFTTESEARSFADTMKASGYIIDHIYPPEKKGARNLLGRWIVYYH